MRVFQNSFLVILLFANLGFSGEATWQMPTNLPPMPNPAETTKPVPRIEWLLQVRSSFDAAKENANEIRLIFDGDSITRGWVAGNGRPVWLERFDKLGAFNFAVGGDGTQHLLWRLDQGQLDGLAPELAVLMIGTNNIRTTPAQVAAGVQAVVKEYRRRLPDTVILLQGILPRGQSPEDPLREAVKATNQLISELHDGEKIIFMDIGAKVLEPDGTISPEIMADFLHLAPKGFPIWADAIQSVIDRYVPAIQDSDE